MKPTDEYYCPNCGVQLYWDAEGEFWEHPDEGYGHICWELEDLDE